MSSPRVLSRSRGETHLVLPTAPSVGGGRLPGVIGARSPTSRPRRRGADIGRNGSCLTVCRAGYIDPRQGALSPARGHSAESFLPKAKPHAQGQHAESFLHKARPHAHGHSAESFLRKAKPHAQGHSAESFLHKVTVLGSGGMVGVRDSPPRVAGPTSPPRLTPAVQGGSRSSQETS